MKKLCMIVVLILMLMGCCLSAYASEVTTDYSVIFNELEDFSADKAAGYTIGATVVCVSKSSITDPNLTYQELNRSSNRRIAVINKDEQPVGMMTFVLKDGTWVMGETMFNGSYLQDAIDTYGEDIVVLTGGEKMIITADDLSVRYLYETDQLNTVMLRSISDMNEPISFEEFMICTAYDNATPNDPEQMGDGDIDYTESYLNEAKAYWAENQESNWMLPVVIVCLFASVVVAVIVLKTFKAAKRK